MTNPFADGVAHERINDVFLFAVALRPTGVAGGPTMSELDGPVPMAFVAVTENVYFIFFKPLMIVVVFVLGGAIVIPVEGDTATLYLETANIFDTDAFHTSVNNVSDLVATNFVGAAGGPIIIDALEHIPPAFDVVTSKIYDIFAAKPLMVVLVFVPGAAIMIPVEGDAVTV